MAISPANCFWPGSAGKESTSVGLSLPRKRRFRDFISALEVSSAFTEPFSPAAWRARARKRLKVSSVRSATRFWKMTTFGPDPGLVAQVRLLGRRRQRGWLRRAWLWLQKRQLLLREMRFVLVVGADDSLYKVMTHYVALVEVHEGDAVYALQN